MATTNILEDYSDKIGLERAKWIDEVVLKNIPEWKVKIITKTKSKLIARLLNVNVEIQHMTLIADFGTETIVILNGKIIGRRKFNLEMKV